MSRGHYNFDTVRFEYYRDRDVAFEGFTGRNYLFREEFTSRIWATRYDFPAIKDKRVKREVIPDHTPSGAQGWFLNTRLPKFKDRKLREALICAFDFEWTNKSIMYGSYDRTHSVFQNSEMMANGKPDAGELALIEPFRGKVPDEVFGEPFVPPVSDGSGADRGLLRRGAQLLNEAGYAIKSGKRIGPNGERITVEFLIEEPTFQPHHMPFIKNLNTLGIDATMRIVDPVQMQNRRNDFDYEVVIQRFGFSATPGDSLRSFFSSQAASLKGSQNRRDRRPGDRRHDREGDCREQPPGAGDGLPGAGPADPGRPLLDPPLVQGVALDRLLGLFQPPRDQTALRPGGLGNLVVRSREGRQDCPEGLKRRWQSRLQSVILPTQDCLSQSDSHPSHGRLHRPPPLVHDPDLARHHAGFIRGGAIRAGRAD